MRLCTVRPTPQSVTHKKDKSEINISVDKIQGPTPLQLSFEIVSHTKKPLVSLNYCAHKRI